MSKDHENLLAQRIKGYEAPQTEPRFTAGLPVCVRVDGRAFSRFTQNMEKPFDADFCLSMIDTAMGLMDDTGARHAYLQSDEITLILDVDDPSQQVFFDGRVFKITSVTAALATSHFTTALSLHMPGHAASAPPVFDCRAFQVPSRDEAVAAIIWRETDAMRNSISSAARAHFTAPQMHGKDRNQMIAMLAEAGVDYEAYPAVFRRGMHIQRRRVMHELTDAEMLMIPEAHRPTGPVERTEMVLLDIPPLFNLRNAVDVVFQGAEPVLSRAAA